MPAGSIISGVSASTNKQSCEVQSVQFNDYNSQPALTELSSGWLNIDYINVTLKKIEPVWNDKQTVTIKLNDSDSLKFDIPATAFEVPKRKFSATDVNISNAELVNGQYVVTLSSDTSAPLGTYVTDVSAKIKGTTTTIDTVLSTDKTKVTLPNVPGKLWDSQTIELTVNASNNVTKSADVLTIDAIAEDDITVGNATWDGTNSRYEIPVTYNGASPSAITTVTSSNGTAAFAKKSDGTTDDTTKIFLTGVPDKLWESTPVTVTISDGGTNTVQNTAVLTIPAFEATDFTVAGPESFTDDGTYSYSITRTGVTIPEDKVSVEGATLTWNSGTSTASFPLAKTWDNEQTVTLKLNGLTLKTLIVPALSLSDFTVSGPESFTTDGTYEYTISRTGLTIPTAKVTADGATVTWDETNSKATLTLAEAWDNEQTVTLKLNGWTVKTLSISKKTVTAANISFKKAQTENEALTWSAELEKLEFEITLVDGNTALTAVTIPANGVAVSDASFGTLEEQVVSGKTLYRITAPSGEKIEKAVAVNIQTSNGNLTSVLFFPQLVNENIITKKLFGANDGQEVYTFGDSPKSAAALQSRIIELPRVIQKVWDVSEEKKEEVTAVVAPTSEVVQSKKSSKKVSKKAAKKAVEAVKETAATIAVTELPVEAVKETAATIAVTELPVEALEEPKADDQLAMILPKTANTEEAELVEPQASVSTGSVDVSVTEAEPAGHSNAALWIILVVFCAAIAGLVLCLKKKRT